MSRHAVKLMYAILMLTAAATASAAAGDIGIAALLADARSGTTDDFDAHAEAVVLQLLQNPPEGDDASAISAVAEELADLPPETLPGLLKVLEQVLSADVRATEFSLAPGDRIAIVDAALSALADTSPKTRAEALAVLSHANDPRVIDPVIDALADPHWNVRFRALIVLEQFSEGEAGDHVREAARPLTADADPQVSEMARIIVGSN